MMKTVKCQHCHKDLEIQEEWLGMEADCPICSKRTLLTDQLPHPAASATVAIKKKHLIAGGAFLGTIIIILLFCTLNGTTKSPEKPVPPPQKAAIDAVKIKPVPKVVTVTQKKEEEYTDFGLQNMVSGIPKVIKPAAVFDIRKYIPQLNTPNDADMRSRYSLHIKFEEKKWIIAAENEMFYAVRNGNCLDIAVLLKIGYDINGEYSLPNSTEKATPLHMLLMSSTDLHDFMKTYIFLCENGADLNKSFNRHDSPFRMLLQKCRKSKSRELWKLIPYSAAYGMKIDTKSIPYSADPEFREYVLKAANSKIRKPALKTENRSSSFKEQFKQLHVSVQKPQTDVINPVARNSFPVCNHQTDSNRLNSEGLRKVLQQGFYPNVLLLCSSSMHGQGSDKRYHEPITNFVSRDQESLLCLLVNNWQYGLETTFKENFRYYDEKLIHAFWACGADITPEMLNITFNKKRWQLLKSLYDRQLCRFSADRIIIREESAWSMYHAREAVMYNNFSKLQKIAAEKNSNLNYDILLYMAAQRRKSEKIMQFCLDKGANPAWTDKNNTNAMDMALKNKHFDNAVFLCNTGKLELPYDKLLDSFVYTVLYPMSGDSAIDQKLSFLTAYRKKNPEACQNPDKEFSTKQFDRLVSHFAMRINQKRAQTFVKAMDWFKTNGFRPSPRVVKKACASRYVKKEHITFLNSLLEK